ncbi:Transposon Tf2-8 polyprotein [Abeliophyllum distichum]|uniref:Transposon Tf2-8 polyprotein n=1 Tax=Abeliophyllum distichum TaxID=126358 RepID=A0ABD1RPL0_9LAMI
MALMAPCALQLDEVRKAIETDEELGKIVVAIHGDPLAHHGYSLLRGTLMYKDRMVLPKGSHLFHWHYRRDTIAKLEVMEASLRPTKGSAYHPQSHGQTEVVNRRVETYLRCFASVKPKRWFQFLHWAEFSYNTSFHVSVQFTLFRILSGRDPSPLLPFAKGATAVTSLEQQLYERDEVLEELKIHLHKAQQQMKSAADKHKREVEFANGDFVYVKMRP